MEFTGRVIAVVDKTKEGSSFKVRQVVVKEEVSEYPQTAAFDALGDKVSIPEVGDKVTVQFNLKASEYNGKWYSRESAWKIEVLEAGQKEAGEAEVAGDVAGDTEGDLPF